jgi:hypothetical protein
MVSKWERGADTDTNGYRSVTIVPGYALVAAARVAQRSVSDLLSHVGVGQPEPGPTVQSLKRRQEMIEEALNELRAERGLPPLPIPVETDD